MEVGYVFFASLALILVGGLAFLAYSKIDEKRGVEWSDARLWALAMLGTGLVVLLVLVIGALASAISIDTHGYGGRD
jgi:uncharacterized membrane protein